MTTRAFLRRWNLRLMRREASRQLLLIAMVGLAVALSVAASVSVFNLVEPPGHTYGNGRLRASTSGDAGPVVEALEEQGHPYGTVRTAAAPPSGSTGVLDLREQVPGDPVTGPLLALTAGEEPANADEVAVTDGLLAQLDLAVGDRTAVAGRTVTVTAEVENPTDLDDEFILVADLDSFEVSRITTTFLVDADPLSVVFPAGVENLSTLHRGPDSVTARTGATALVLSATIVAMLEVAIVAGAGFAVLASGRARQYGLVGALGATEGDLRRLAVANGAVVGVTGAALGSLVGLTMAALVVPNFETAVGHRINLAVPWWAVAGSFAMGTAAAVIGAWWPARRLATQAVTELLAARRPRPRPVTRVGLVGAVAGSVGLAILIVAAARSCAPLVVLGAVLVVVAALLLAPAAVAASSAAARRAPLPVRLAARDNRRSPARSGAVVAALALSLGIPLAVVAVSASIDERERRADPNLPDDTAVLWVPGADDPGPMIPADVAPPTDALDSVARAVPDAEVVPIEVAVVDDRTEHHDFERLGSRPAVLPVVGLRPTTEACNCDVYAFGDLDESGAELVFTAHDAWVGTPELSEALGLGTGTGTGTGTGDGDGDGAGSARWDDLSLSALRRGDTSALEVDPALPAFSRLAPVLLAPDAVEAEGWSTVTIGWLLTTPEPLSEADRDTIRRAAGTGLVSEFRVEPSSGVALRLVTLAVGMVVALGIVTAAALLHVSESAADRRILGALGASTGTARTVAAASSALLTVGGAVLSVLFGAAALAAVVPIQGVNLPLVVPWLELTAVLVATPLAAAVVGAVAAAPIRAPRARLAAPGPAVALAVTLVASLAATSCTSDVTSDQTAGQASDKATGADCDPGLDQALEQWSEAGFSGSVAILGGDRSCVAAYGTADEATGRANTVDTSFSIGSVTKAVTAAAVIDLIDQGVLDLDDKAGRHVPELTGTVADVTLRQLLLHTSGLSGQHGADHQPLSRDEAVAAISELDIAFEPGTDYAYSNAGYTLLALVVEAVTDQGYRGYLTSEILTTADGEPFGGFWDGEPAAPEPRAVGRLGGGPGESGDFAGPHWALDGNGGIAVTALELAEWTRDLFAGRILSDDATDLLLATATALGEDGTELPGWVRLDADVIGEEVIAASGGGGSIRHQVTVGWFPASQRVVVIAQNDSGPTTGSLIGDVLRPLVVGAGIPGPPDVELAAAEQLEAVAGRYLAGDDGVVDVQPDEGGLRVTAEGAEAIEALFPVPAELESLVEEHEQAAVAFATGETEEGAGELARLEAEHGPLVSTEVAGSVDTGELRSFLHLSFADDHRMVLDVALDEQGATMAISYDEWPSAWFSLRSDGGYDWYDRPENHQVVVLHPVGDDAEAEGLRIEGPPGTDDRGVMSRCASC